MPTATYIPLANISLTGNTSITISSITAGYRDLVIVMNGEGGNGDAFPRLRFNGDSNQNYSYVVAQSTGGGGVQSYVSETETALQGYNGCYYSINNRTTTIFNIMDFSATDKHKSVLVRNGRTGQGTEMLVARWASTSAITSIQLISSNGNSFSNGTLSVYGIAA